MNLISPSIADHILMAIMCIIMPLSAVMYKESEEDVTEFDTNSKVDLYYGNGLTMWIITLILCLVWFFSGRPLYEIGFELPQFHSSLWAILVGGFVFIYALDAWNDVRNDEARALTKKRLQNDVPFLPTTKLEFQHFIILSITAGFCEEVIFRGYCIQYFQSFMGITPLGKFMAIALPGIVFALSHLYQGWKAVAKIMVLAVIFGYIFLETGSLWVVIVLHILVDLMSGYLAMRLLKEEST